MNAVSTSPRRVVILRTDRLGEVVLTLAMARAIREAGAAATVDMVVAPALQQLVRCCPDACTVLTYESPGEWWSAYRLGRRLRRACYEAAVIASPRKELHVAAWLAGIPIRVGYGRKWGQHLLTHALVDGKAGDTKHELEWHAQLLTLLGIHRAVSAPRLAVPEDAYRAMQQRLAQVGVGPSERVVAMHPWASTTRKRWSVASFMETARRLEASGRTRIIITGGAEHAEETAPTTPSSLNWTGQTSLLELAALLKRSVCLLSNDSGPVHVAAAVGTPVVALFGTADAGSHPRRWGPWGTGHTVIHQPLEAMSVAEVMTAVGRYVSHA